MSRILNTVNKLLNPGMGGTGVLVATRDLWALYANPSPPANVTPGAGALGDDDTVAILGVSANETAAAQDTTGNPVSTTTPVGTTTYTSKGFYTQGFAQITGTCFSNANGTAYVDQSPDGQNWDLSTSTAITGATGASFSVAVVAPYARIRFVPSANNTVLRFYAFLRRI